MTTTTKIQDAYWLNGTPYCAACVEADEPCLDATEISQATRGPASSTCGCCGGAIRPVQPRTLVELWRDVAEAYDEYADTGDEEYFQQHVRPALLALAEDCRQRAEHIAPDVE